MSMRKFLVLIAILAVTALPANAGVFKNKFVADEPPKVNLSGKVVDPQGKPVKGAQVLLRDRETGEMLQSKTDKNGAFVIAHERTEYDALQVIAPIKLKLAQATLTDIPAEDGRHVLVKLKPGVTVSGKVVAEGRPLPNVVVKAVSKKIGGVHEGGMTRTNRKGEWQLTITPGEKIFEVSDVRVNAIVGLYREKHVVTADGPLPEIALPPSRTAGL